MAKDKQTAPADEMANVEQALNASEKFIEKNQKPILYTVSAIVLVILAVLAFRNFYLDPKAEEASNEIYRAEAYFAVDSFRVALEGDGMDCIGFEAVADQYGITPAGNLAKFYAGACCYKLGNYQEAAGYLESYKGKDENIVLVAEQLLGDSYIGLGNTEKAVRCFEKVGKAKNSLLSPMSLKKAGMAYENLGNKEKALKAYKAIKDNYPQSQEGMDIDKYIARLEQAE